VGCAGASVRRELVEPGHESISVRRQCELLGVARSGLGYVAKVRTDDLRVMRLLDEQYTRTPFYGVRKMTAWLRQSGETINPKRVRRLLREMGLEAVYPKPNLSAPDREHRVYPYLLRNVKVTRRDQVWSTDITYVRLVDGFAFLMAVMDWWSRYVLSWELSVTMDVGFCVSGLEWALAEGQPEIFNTDQGSQFTSSRFTGVLESRGIDISMDGQGRALDNVFVERLWRSVKYECVFLNEWRTPAQAREGLSRYFRFYNTERLHEALGYETPARWYRGQ
jgi:putative transposase